MIHLVFPAVLSFLGGMICTFLALHIMVPMVVGIVGHRYFAEMEGLDPFGYMLFGGFMTVFLFTPLALRGHGGYGCIV